jgi:hypothetical protein
MSITAETAWIDIVHDRPDIFGSAPVCEQPTGLHEKLYTWFAMD